MSRPPYLVFIFLILTLISCDSGNNEKGMESEASLEKVENKQHKRKVLTPAEIEQANSVLSRLVSNPESRKFASYIISTNLVDRLADDKGTFTVFAPKNESLENFSPESKKYYSDPKNLSELEIILKSHILEGNYNLKELKNIISKKKNSGLKTISETELNFSEMNGEIFISLAKGKKVKILKVDIPASNGQVFIIDGMLGEN